MNQYQVQKRLLEKSNNNKDPFDFIKYSNNNPFDMINYAETGFTLNNVKQNMTMKGLEVPEKKKTKKELFKREDVIQRLFHKNESELTQVQLEMVDKFFKESDVDLSELRRQAKEDYELQQNNYLLFLGKRLKQGWNKDAPGFIWQKTKEIFVEKPLDYIVNNPVSKFVQDIYNFLISMFKNRYLFLIGFVGLFIFVKKV